MRTNDETKTRLTFETNENRYIWESPYMDISVEDVIDAVYGMLVAATWQPATIIEAFKDFADDHMYIVNQNDQDLLRKYQNNEDED